MLKVYTTTYACKKSYFLFYSSRKIKMNEQYKKIALLGDENGNIK